MWKGRFLSKSTKWLPLQSGLVCGAIASALQLLVSGDLIPHLLEVPGTVEGISTNLSLAFLSAWFFNLWVVVLPEKLKRGRIRRWLNGRYIVLKDDLVAHYLSLIGMSYDRELLVTLRDPHQFSSYFNEKYTVDQNRWHAVHNALYDWGIAEIREHCEHFARDCNLAIGLVGDLTEDAARVLQTVDMIRFRANLAEPEYDDIKHLLNALFPLHCSWSALDGKTKEDLLFERIASI